MSDKNPKPTPPQRPTPPTRPNPPQKPNVDIEKGGNNLPIYRNPPPPPPKKE